MVSSVLLASAWVILAISITTLLSAHWLDYYISRSAQKSNLELGKLLTDFLTRRHGGEEIPLEVVTKEWREVVENDKPNERRRHSLAMSMDATYAVANICLISGVILLVIFGAKNLP